MPALIMTQITGTTPNWTMPEALHQAFSTETNIITKWLEELKPRPSPALLNLKTEGQTLEVRVFNALAAAKISTANVAMHLDRDFRDRLFHQLDSLHETDEWEEGEEPLNASSFQTFLKAILRIRPERRPGLGLSQTGNLIAAWTTARDRLTIEFLPNDQVRWALSRYYDDEPVRIAGQMAVSRLVKELAPYEPARWFCYENKGDVSSG